MVSPGRTLRYEGGETTAKNRLLFHPACASTWWIRQNITSSAPRSLVWSQQFYSWIFSPFTGSLIVSFEITWYLTRKIVSHHNFLTSKGNSALLPGNLLHMDITHTKPKARISSELRKHKTNSMYPWECHGYKGFCCKAQSRAGSRAIFKDSSLWRSLLGKLNTTRLQFWLLK